MSFASGYCYLKQHEDCSGWFNSDPRGCECACHKHDLLAVRLQYLLLDPLPEEDSDEWWDWQFKLGEVI